MLLDSTGLKLCGPGEWLIETHGARKRRSWHALHLGMEADTGRIVAATLTGDVAYDRSRVYAAVHERHPEAAMVAPPHVDVVLSDTAATAPTQRDRHIHR